MNKNMKESERKELELEIAAREELLKRLQYPKTQLKKASQKEVEKRQAKIDKMKKYDSYEVAHELWGWGELTDKELDEVKEFFEKGESYIYDTVSAEEYAHRMLTQYMVRVMKEVAGIKYELLPEEEKRRREKEEAENRHQIKSN